MMQITRSIAIDPGHGGSDTGAVSPGGKHREKDVNLHLAAELFARLQPAETIEPLLLRSADCDLSLPRRVERAERECADLYLSLHHNGFGDPTARGCETFCCPGGESERAARLIQDMIISWLPVPDRGIRDGRNFYVIHSTTMPAVLVEPLFLTSPADLEQLEHSAYYAGLAEMLEKALMSWADSTI